MALHCLIHLQHRLPDKNDNRKYTQDCSHWHMHTIDTGYHQRKCPVLALAQENSRHDIQNS